MAWIDEVQGQYTGPVGENTRAVEMPVMGESAPSAVVREGNIIRRDTSTATPGDAMTWQEVYNYESRSDAPAEVTQEPVSAADRAEMDAYMDALAQDENILTDDPYTPADAVYDAQLRRLAESGTGITSVSLSQRPASSASSAKDSSQVKGAAFTRRL